VAELVGLAHICNAPLETLLLPPDALTIIRRRAKRLTAMAQPRRKSAA
jgi:hypothetical protein